MRDKLEEIVKDTRDKLAFKVSEAVVLGHLLEKLENLLKEAPKKEKPVRETKPQAGIIKKKSKKVKKEEKK